MTWHPFVGEPHPSKSVCPRRTSQNLSPPTRGASQPATASHHDSRLPELRLFTPRICRSFRVHRSKTYSRMNLAVTGRAAWADFYLLVWLLVFLLGRQGRWTIEAIDCWRAREIDKVVQVINLRAWIESRTYCFSAGGGPGAATPTALLTTLRSLKSSLEHESGVTMLSFI